MVLIDAFKQYKGLPREVYILSFQRFINSLGGFVYPFLTMFLSLKVGLEKEHIGLLLMVSSLVGIPGSLISGSLIDRYSRKKILLISSYGAAMLLLLCGFMEPTVNIAYMVILANFVGSFGRPASGAMTSDLTKPENRKQSFSLFYLGMNLGLAFGFWMAGLLFVNHWRWLFIGDGLTTMASLLLVIFFVKDTKPSKEELEAIDKDIDRVGEKTETGSVFRAIAKRPFLMAFVLINAAIGFVYHQHGFVMNFQLEELFTGNGPKYFGYIMMFNTIQVIIFTPFIMAATKRFKPIVNVLIATMTYFVGFGMLAFVSSFYWFFISTFIWTTGEIIAAVNAGVYISNHSPANHRGKFSSIIGIIKHSGMSAAPWIMGMYLGGGRHSSEEGWLLTAVVALVCAALLGVMYIKENRRESLKGVNDIA